MHGNVVGSGKQCRFVHGILLIVLRHFMCGL